MKLVIAMVACLATGPALAGVTVYDRGPSYFGIVGPDGKKIIDGVVTVPPFIVITKPPSFRNVEIDVTHHRDGSKTITKTVTTEKGTIVSERRTNPSSSRNSSRGNGGHGNGGGGWGHGFK